MQRNDVNDLIGTKELVSYADFEAIDIRVGTIVAVRINEKAKKPAYILEIDFGSEIGTKVSSAQITEGHARATLKGMQVVAVMNFPPKKVADTVSEILVLGVVQSHGPTILLMPALSVQNGSTIL